MLKTAFFFAVQPAKKAYGLYNGVLGFVLAYPDAVTQEQFQKQMDRLFEQGMATQARLDDIEKTMQTGFNQIQDTINNCFQEARLEDAKVSCILLRNQMCVGWYDTPNVEAKYEDCKKHLVSLGVSVKGLLQQEH